MMPRKNMTIRGNYALFWGQWPSNWEASPFTIDGKSYTCVEQWMMAEKARLFGDTVAEARIMATADPADQKRYGRGVKGYVEDQWAAVRYQIVLRGVVEKYRQNEHLREKLLATGDLQFVEASPEDRVWGIGMRATDPGADNPRQWRGQNLLGKATTEARETIRAEMALAGIP
jgi:hypothetical protein